MTTTETKERHNITKDDIAGLKNLLDNLRSVYQNSGVVLSSTDLNLYKFSEQVEKSVSCLEEKWKDVAVDIFCNRSEDVRTLDGVKNKWGKSFELTVDALSADLDLEQEDVKVLLSAFKEVYVQFGPSRGMSYLLVRQEIFEI